MAYERIAIYAPHEILDVIVSFVPYKERHYYIKEFNGMLVDMSSIRYRVFQRSLACVSCGCVGEIMALERQKNDAIGRAHFNLYAIRYGFEILMTKDHIIPKSRGGSNRLENFQTMCKYCNEEKGDTVE